MKDILQLPEDSAEFGLNIITISSKTIPVEKIALPEISADMNFHDKDNRLSGVYPLIVHEYNGMYRIIDGCKRYRSAVNQKKAECACTVLENITDLCQSSYLRIVFNLNRELSFREKLFFVNWLRKNSSDALFKKITSEFPFNSRESHELESLCDISDSVIKHIEQGHLDPSVASELGAFNLDTSELLLDFLSKLQFSRSNQREFLEWLPEIADRKSCTIAEILSSPTITEIMLHPTINQPQKVQKIRELLFEERFPLYSSVKADWVSLSRRLNPDPAHFQFIASDSFEKNRLEMKITVKSSKEIISIIEKLKNISSEQWDKLIYPANEL